MGPRTPCATSPKTAQWRRPGHGPRPWGTIVPSFSFRVDGFGGLKGGSEKKGEIVFFHNSIFFWGGARRKVNAPRSQLTLDVHSCFQ